MMFDITNLQAIVNKCFDWSSDGTLSQDQQQSFFNLGMHLRDDMMNAYAKKFSDNDTRITQLNAQLTSVNNDIQQQANVAANYAATINSITKCVGYLDTILSIAASA